MTKEQIKPETMVFAVVDRETQGIDFMLYGFTKAEQDVTMAEYAGLDVEPISFKWCDAPEPIRSLIEGN